MYNFDEIIERRGTGSVKWDEAPGSDIIPLWVADMDFAVAPPIQQAIKHRAEHPVFGYTCVDDEYYQAIIAWFERRHGWTIRREHILYTTGVVPAVSCVLKALTLPGEKVLLHTPAYNCFFSSIRNSGCEVLGTALTDNNGCFSTDWTDFEQKCADEKTTVFLLCNPHNPSGRVWTREELERMADICRRHGVRVVSDEIHCELLMPGHEFVPFATVSAEAIVLNSPSKAFNIAGLQVANIICPDPELRRRIDRAININEVCDLNAFAPSALIAAYNEGEQWLDELCQYLYDNYIALCRFVADELPQLRVSVLEGTYLPWIDISALGIGAQQLCERLITEGRVWVNPGTLYDPESGSRYIRVNIACPRSRLMEGLRRMAAVIRA